MVLLLSVLPGQESEETMTYRERQSRYNDQRADNIKGSASGRAEHVKSGVP